MSSMRRPTEASKTSSSGGLAIARARGDAARLEWVRSGAVIPPAALSSAWAVSPQFLTAAARRGDVFAVTVNERRYYPCEFAQLARQDVAAICQELTAVDAAERLVFFQRKHGALAGKTVLEALTSGSSRLEDVVAVARRVTAQARADHALSRQ